MLKMNNGGGMFIFRRLNRFIDSIRLKLFGNKVLLPRVDRMAAFLTVT